MPIHINLNWVVVLVHINLNKVVVPVHINLNRQLNGRDNPQNE